MSSRDERAESGFYPAPLPVPDGARTDRLALRPLCATDAEIDYDAVMSSAAELRLWSGGGWPADHLTLEEDIADLERHEREHEDRAAFTYTVLGAGGGRCLGCVYVQPIWPEATALCAGATRAAAVGFWVRTSELASDLDRHLLLTLLDWFRGRWAFGCILFTNTLSETRQAELLAEAGLVCLPLTWPDGSDGRAFRARFADRL